MFPYSFMLICTVLFTQVSIDRISVDLGGLGAFPWDKPGRIWGRVVLCWMYSLRSLLCALLKGTGRDASGLETLRRLTEAAGYSREAENWKQVSTYTLRERSVLWRGSSGYSGWQTPRSEVRNWGRGQLLAAIAPDYAHRSETQQKRWFKLHCEGWTMEA